MASTIRERAGRHSPAVSIVLSVAAYTIVAGTFLGALPYPRLELHTVNVLTHVIAAINTIALAVIIQGWRLARRRRFRLHRAMMITAFSLIVLFLVIYLFKVGGGGTKEFVGPLPVRDFIYLPMLFVHLALSVLAVPLVLYALVLGLTHRIPEMPSTNHARVARWAVLSWSVSLALGIITYVMLNHLYDWRYLET